MKTIEEKAKAYDKALERTSELLSKCITNFDRRTKVYRVEDIESIFPELKKSEDELIKEDLIGYISEFPDMIWRGHYKEDVISWLKKQVNIPIKVTQEVEVGNGNLKALVTEEISTDKVEPKFHEGDLIKHNKANIIRKVISVNSGSYYVTNIETNGKNIELFNAEQNFHLWTIQDAKDGDVIQLGKVTAIFQKYIGNGNCKCHCSVCGEEFEIPSQDGPDNSYGCINAIPATKEQCETLFKAMHEAGYKWIADTKELEKIEEDEQIKKAIIHILKGETGYISKEDTNKYIAWLEKQNNTLEIFKNEENEKLEFVGYGFLKCKCDFLSFEKGETYWLEYIGKDNYNVRSDNLLRQTFHITPQQLYTMFQPTTCRPTTRFKVGFKVDD